MPTKIELPGSEKEVGPDGVASDEVRLHLLQGGPNEVRDFKVKRSNIKKIEYFEDMLLKECDRLVMAHDYARAFECCLRVQTRNPGWPGLDDHVNRVLFAEGSTRLDRRRRRARPAGSWASCWGGSVITPDLLDQIGGAYTQTDRAGLEAGPLCSRPPGLARIRGACARARDGQGDASALCQQGESDRQGHGRT